MTDQTLPDQPVTLFRTCAERMIGKRGVVLESLCLSGFAYQLPGARAARAQRLGARELCREHLPPPRLEADAVARAGMPPVRALPAGPHLALGELALGNLPFFGIMRA